MPGIDAINLSLAHQLWLMVSLPQLLFGIGWFIAAKSLREFQPGLFALTVFNAANGFALILVSYRGSIDPLYSDILANILMLGGFLQLWRGTAFFFNNPLDQREVLALFVVGSALLATFGTVIPNPQYRVAALMFLMAWICLRCVMQAYARLQAGGGNRAATRALMVMGAIVVTALLLRGFNGLFGGQDLGLEQVTVLNLGWAYFLMAGTFSTNLLFAFFLTGTIVQRLHNLSRKDALTGLFNRRALMESMDREWHRYHTSGDLLTLVSIDFDHFKKINDNHGHLAGDEVLVKAADIMRQQIRPSDVLARSGGEEFTLLLPDTDLDTARSIAERLRQAVSEAPNLHPEPEQYVSVSVGVARVNDQDNRLDSLLARADAALYRAKAEGRDQVAIDNNIGTHCAA